MIDGQTIKSQSAEQAQANIDALFAVNPAPKAPAAEPVEAADAPGNRNAGTRFPHFADNLIPPENGDVLAELPVRLLVDFPKDKHPFRPYTPQELEALKDDIIQHGILQPLLVRPHPTRPGHYQIIAGHNRRTAAVEVGYTTLPCIVRQMDDDEALLQMISSNLKQRSELLPSEKAWAYKYQLDAMKRQGRRTDLTSSQLGQKLKNETSCHVGTKFRSDVQLSENADESARTIQRYIRLTYLTPELLKKADERKLPLTVGETISYISHPGQQIVENFFFLQRTFPITQAIADRLRQMDEAGSLSEQELETAFLSPHVVRHMKTVSIKMKKWRKYFDADATERQVVDVIEKALHAYFEKEEVSRHE